MAKKQYRDVADDEFEVRGKKKPRQDRSTSVRFADAPSAVEGTSMREESMTFRPVPEGNFDRPRPTGSLDRPREFFPATCASCGAQTTVPFKPMNGRPVRCRPCFQAG
jgi:CxxC-x17-CxxC domain-containing protein